MDCRISKFSEVAKLRVAFRCEKCGFLILVTQNEAKSLRGMQILAALCNQFSTRNGGMAEEISWNNNPHNSNYLRIEIKLCVYVRNKNATCNFATLVIFVYFSILTSEPWYKVIMIYDLLSANRCWSSLPLHLKWKVYVQQHNNPKGSQCL